MKSTVFFTLFSVITVNAYGSGTTMYTEGERSSPDKKCCSLEHGGCDGADMSHLPQCGLQRDDSKDKGTSGTSKESTEETSSAEAQAQ
ncbi:MAG: hypothetical protein K2P81_11565 [Bacteriovoracaceae bacterium]|nr:hypothetical protein [Bacteriovoracaceae bacterium]